MLSSPLFFDIDSSTGLQNALNCAKNIQNYIQNEFHRIPDWIVFTGRRGFHLVYWEWEKDTLQMHPKKRIQQFILSRKNLIANMKKKIPELKELDETITLDPFRVLRIPGSIHSKSGFPAFKMNSLVIQEFNIKLAKFKPELDL